MSELNVARITTLLRRLFVLRGEQGIVPELEDSIMPAVILENDRPEFAYLADAMLQWGALTTTAVLAERAWVRLLNPADSGVIVVVEAIQPVPLSSTHVDVTTGGTDVATADISGPFNRDFRLDTIVSRIGAVHLQGGTDAVKTGQLVWRFPPTGVTQAMYDPCPVIVDPGRFLDVANLSSNVQLTCAFRWRERAMERSERRLP